MKLHLESKGTRSYFIYGEKVRVHKETLLKHLSNVGTDITEATWKKILNDNAYYFLLDKALNKLAYQAHTEQSLFDRLEAEIPLKNQVITELVTLGYLNDERLLDLYMKEYAFEDMSLRAFQDKLIKKGFKKALVKSRLESFDDDQGARLKSALEKRMKHLKKDTWLKTKERLMRYAIRLGYPYALIEPALKPFEKRFDVDPEPLLKDEIKRLKKDPKLTQDKMIERLRRKGFSYALIQRLLKEAS